MSDCVVRLPEHATVEDSFELIPLLAELEKEQNVVVVDASRTTRFDPFGVGMIASSVAVRNASSRTTILSAPDDSGARRFLKEIGFDRVCRGDPPQPGTLDMRQLHALDATYTQDVVQLLVDGVPGVNEENSYPIELCLNELLQNVFEWGNSSVGCFVLARWYRNTRSVRLAVVDRGDGIPSVIRRTQLHDLHKRADQDVIEAAVTVPNLTTRPNGVGGLGLKNIRDVVCQRTGRLTIVSLAGRVSWRGSRRPNKGVSPHFRGTAIEIDIRPAPFGTDHANGIL